jgi:serine O-acetyltransferase
LGNLLQDGKWRRPYSENNVIVGSHVVALGDVHIGNNVKIGAGSVVLNDILDNCTVVGNPARIVRKNGERVNIPL